jgi:hypothetical protein
MKKKKELVILLVIIVVLVLYLSFRNRNRTQYQLPEIPKISKSDITKIEIAKHERIITLNKDNNVWRIQPQGYLVDSVKVDNMLDIIGDLAFDSLVSESKNYYRYDLDEEKRIIVRAWAGDALCRELTIGKEAASYQHTFVKLPDDPRVFLAQQGFKRRFDQTVNDLRDKSVLSFDPAEIQEIRITTHEKTMALSKNEVPEKKAIEDNTDEEANESPPKQAVWQTASGEEKDKTIIEQLLTDLSRLRCDEYINDHAKDDFNNPIYTVRLKGVKEYALSIFKKNDSDANKQSAVSSENDYPFLLFKWKVENIFKKSDGLFQKPNKSKAE